MPVAENVVFKAVIPVIAPPVPPIRKFPLIAFAAEPVKSKVLFPISKRQFAPALIVKLLGTLIELLAVTVAEVFDMRKKLIVCIASLL